MLFINRLLRMGLLSVGITAATTAQPANQRPPHWQRVGGVRSDAYLRHLPCRWLQ